MVNFIFKSAAMRLLLFLILFPVFLFAQELPDSAIAAKLGVKKLVIFRLENGQPNDTHAVYVFDRGWKDRNGFPPEGKPAPDSLLNLVYDANGLIASAKVNDVMHYLYIPLFDWKAPDQEPRPFASNVTLRYLYFY